MPESEILNDDLIKIGDYIIIQRQGYFKLHQLSVKGDLLLGKDRINIRTIVGHKFWSMFKIIPKKSRKREFFLSKCDNIPDIVMKEMSCGMDNRNISDDGKSQLLSTEDIVSLRESGLSAQNIVGKLIENSTTFKEKTEYSQEKYLKKKEKKYFEYIIVRKPTLRLIAAIYYKKDPYKIMGLRYDTLSQILSLGNIHHNGTYILFENGTQALVGAAILNCLSDSGALINLSVNQPSKQAILGLNLDGKQGKRLLTVDIRDFLSALRDKSEPFEANNEQESQSNIDKETQSNIEEGPTDQTNLEEPTRKRKITEGNCSRPKKRKWAWAAEFVEAVNLVKENLADGLIIASKEYPLNIFENLVNFVKPSRQIVIYSLHREPLVDLYIEMKKRTDLVGIHLSETWLRTYQILPDRTHPDVTMSPSGGHLLTATKVI